MRLNADLIRVVINYETLNRTFDMVMSFDLMMYSRLRIYFDKIFIDKQTLEKTEGAIKNGPSRDTDNIGHTRHRQNKSNTTEKTKKVNNTTHQTTGVNPAVSS